MTSPHDPRWPSVPDLRVEPGLAILAALDVLISLAARSLAAVHPSVSDSDQPYWQQTPTDRIAPDIVDIAHRLQAALESYRNAIVIERPATLDDELDDTDPHDKDDMPF